ncbi:hypothetical protein GOP47_0026501 [Adiantum capillus-veneris]|nr:hypothetical protein GOP47_0026501 [Adiantum capillus-veneris]
MLQPYLLLLYSLSLVAVAAATYLPVPPPIECNTSGCTVENYQRIWLDRKPCKAARAVYPTSEAELFDAVAWASKTGSKIKVVSKGSHSLPKLVCPGGDEGLLVSTELYNSILHVNLSSRTVTAQAGVMLRDLLDAIAAEGLSLPHTPYWEGVSVAGMISTGAHGSGMWLHGSAPHDYVVGIRLIVPSSPEYSYAQILDLIDGHDDLNAARLSLGLLGAISTVTFQLEPMFKRSVTLQIKEDEHLEDDILKFAQDHEFGGLSWYPGTHKVLLKFDDRVSVETPGNGAYKLALVDKMDVQVIESLRKDQESFEEMQDVDALCEKESMFMNFRHSFGDGLVNDGTTFTGYPVIGFNHKMQTSGGCDRKPSPLVTARGIDFEHVDEHSQDSENSIEHILDSSSSKALFTCNWNPLINHSFFFFDIAISIPTHKTKDVILEIKKLRDVDPKAMCALGSYGGFWIRFQTKSKAYLGEPYDSVVFEFFSYRAKKAHNPRVYQDLFEEIEQLLVSKFGGKPHWGKNRPLTFDGMHSRTLALGKFLEAKKRLDPMNLFSNEWTDSILQHESSSGQTLHDHCALEGLCVCREDTHCHPNKGYFCRAGHLFQEARVCRYEK